jgi:hypothetical protein
MFQGWRTLPCGDFLSEGSHNLTITTYGVEENSRTQALSFVGKHRGPALEKDRLSPMQQHPSFSAQLQAGRDSLRLRCCENGLTFSIDVVFDGGNTITSIRVQAETSAQPAANEPTQELQDGRLSPGVLEAARATGVAARSLQVALSALRIGREPREVSLQEGSNLTTDHSMAPEVSTAAMEHRFDEEALDRWAWEGGAVPR